MNSKIEFKIEDDAFFTTRLAINEAMRTIVEAMMNDKGKSGKVTATISLETNTFKDGYSRLRDGVAIKTKIDNQMVSKDSYSDEITTTQMMLEENEEGEWILVPAPDPQKSINDYL